MTFEPGLIPPQELSERAYQIIFLRSKILVRLGATEAVIPQGQSAAAFGIVPVRPAQYLGLLDGKPCFATDAEEPEDELEGLEFTGLRGLFNLVDENLFFVLGRAFQVIHWDRTHQFCGRCGTRMEQRTDERAKSCPACGLVSYPRISPAVIVAIVRDGKILLAHATRFPGKMYSVLAGFVEVGENFEECVEREVMEEVGIKVKNIRYFGSQPWPFPNSIMIGFTAEYAGGEITPDPTEIAHADWFSPDNMPETPGKISIASKLISWFLDNYPPKVNG